MSNDQINTDSSANGSPVYSVSELMRETKTLLETEIGTVWVEGEISNLARPASGHLYFTLRDDRSQIRCALFRMQRQRLPVEPENGQQVRARARVSLYEPRGDFQLIVEILEPAGMGALQRAYEALKLKLLNEGLFEPDRKQQLPMLPKRIAIITSPSGAVIHDILTTLKRRFPAIEVLLFPVPVQGNDAAPAIVDALRLANKRQDCDVIILARGGGSLEDLWAFNEETVARAIFDSDIPVVSSIGHETDFTIADFVADARAPTPTAAAEMLSPNAKDWLASLEDIELRLQKIMRDQIAMLAQKLDLTGRRLTHPGQRIQSAVHQMNLLTRRLELVAKNYLGLNQARLTPLTIRLSNIKPDSKIRILNNSFDSLSKRLTHGANHSIEKYQDSFTGLVKRLNTLNPLETLGRGFAIFYKEDKKTIVSSIHTVNKGDQGYIQVADGKIQCLIEELYDNTK